MTHSTFSRLCLMLKWRPQCASIKNVMAAKSSASAASTSSPLFLFATATSYLAEPQNCALLYKPGGVASNWKTNPTQEFLLLLYCFIISTVTWGTILLGKCWLMMNMVVTCSVRRAGMSCGGRRKQRRGWWWWWWEVKQQYLKLELPKKTLCHQATLPGTEKWNNLSVSWQRVKF